MGLKELIWDLSGVFEATLPL